MDIDPILRATLVQELRPTCTKWVRLMLTGQWLATRAPAVLARLEAARVPDEEGTPQPVGPDEPLDDGLSGAGYPPLTRAEVEASVGFLNDLLAFAAQHPGLPAIMKAVDANIQVN